jgi:phage regulator Rha-like protein
MIKKTAKRKKVTAITPVSVVDIGKSILFLRGQRILLDSDLAMLYGVPTKRFNEAVKRNVDRFPGDFMFQLSTDETGALRSQIATSKPGRGGRRYVPYAFTEHGAIMAAMVLNSARAVEMSVYVVRAFIQLREALASNRELARQLKILEDRVARKFAQQDHAIDDILKTIRELMSQPASKSRPIGFTANLDEKR